METTSNETNLSGITAEISTVLDDFFNENYGASYRNLEKASSVSRKLISKLHNGDIKEDKICPIKLYSVLSKINPAKAIQIIFSKDEWGKKVTTWKSLEKKKLANSISDLEVEAIVLENDYTATVFMLSLMPNGVTRETLAEIGGNLLISGASRLVSNGIIDFDGERYLSKSVNIDSENRIFSFSRERLGSFIATTNKYYNPEHAGQNRNYRFLNIASVNEKCLREMYNETDEYTQKMVNISRLPENRGDIPIFLNTTMDTFIDKIDSDNEVLQWKQNF